MSRSWVSAESSSSHLKQQESREMYTWTDVRDRKAKPNMTRKRTIRTREQEETGGIQEEEIQGRTKAETEAEVEAESKTKTWLL